MYGYAGLYSRCSLIISGLFSKNSDANTIEYKVLGYNKNYFYNSFKNIDVKRNKKCKY